MKVSNDMSQIFDVYRDKNDNLLYNLSKTVYINTTNVPKDYYTEYKVISGDSWTLIAYMEMGDIDLWWMICKFNGISSPIVMPEVGSTIKIPTKAIAEHILTGIR